MTSTLQPISRPISSMYLVLCKVALLTVAPSISTGSRIATGATTPDLPTFHFTSSRVVTTPVCICLSAYAALGWWEVYPLFSNSALSFILNTMPSSGYSDQLLSTTVSKPYVFINYKSSVHSFI